MRKKNVGRPLYYNVRRVDSHRSPTTDGSGMRLSMREEAIERFKKRTRIGSLTSSQLVLSRMRDLMGVGELPKTEGKR